MPYKDPLNEIIFINSQKISGLAKERIVQLHSKYETKLRQIFLIYNNIVLLINDSISAHNKITKWIGKTTLIVDREEIKDWDKLQEIDLLLSLEIENFFIHSRILMDDIAKMSFILFNDKKQIESGSYDSIPKRFCSFHSHRNDVLKSKNCDDAYRSIIKDTEWFNLLRDYRDDYIIHSRPRNKHTLISATGEMSWGYCFSGLSQKDVSYLVNLKEKYKLKVNNNAKEILDYIEKETTSCLTENEKQEIYIIRKKECDIPNMCPLLCNIILFLEKYQKYFISRESSSTSLHS